MANKKKEIIPEELTEAEVWNILEFAQNISGGSLYGGALSPQLLNQQLRNINLNPLQATEDSLNNAMKDPKSSELELMGFSEDFETQSQVYKKLISYLSDMVSFDLTYTCKNADMSDYKSKAYAKDLDAVKDFFDRFDYRKEFRIAIREMLRNEAFFACPRFDGKNIVLQELPSSPTYTLITGRWDYGLLFSFNMYYFMQPGIDIRLYPRFFREKFNELWGDVRQSYNPALPPNLRGDSSWVYWQDIPTDVGFCFKFNPEIATRIPYFSGLFLDLIQQPLMRALQKNINMSAAARIILGQVGLLKDAGAKVKDQFNINPDLLGKFLALVKSAVGESLKVAAAPLEEMQAISFPAENDVYQSYLRTALASSGVNTNLLFTSSVRPNSVESQLSLNNDEQLLYSLYPQFEAFLNYYVNKFTKKFKFNFKFEGTHFFNNRAKRLEDQMTLVNSGIVLPQKIAAAIGMNPFEFQRQLEEARASGFVDDLTPIKKTLAGAAAGIGKEDAGRPKKSDGELTDSGGETRDSGANEEKKLAG